MNDTKYYNPEYDFIKSLELEKGKNYFLKVDFNQLEKIVEHFNFNDYEDLQFYSELGVITNWDYFIKIINKNKHFRFTQANKDTWLSNLKNTYFLLRKIPESKRNKAIIYFQLKIENYDYFKYDKSKGYLDTSIEYNDKALIIEYSYINRFRNLNSFIQKKQEQLNFYIDNYESDNNLITNIDGTIFIDNLSQQVYETKQKIKKLFDL